MLDIGADGSDKSGLSLFCMISRRIRVTHQVPDALVGHSARLNLSERRLLQRFAEPIRALPSSFDSASESLWQLRLV